MWLINVIKRLRDAGMAFAVVLLVGTLGFAYLSSWQWMDAFYMTAITLTTIGFHEVIDLSESPEGRIFTVFIAFSGVGVFTYLVSNLGALLIEGDIRKTFYIQKMEKKISKMRDHYIICGNGRVGSNVAEELIKTESDFVMADMDETQLERLAAAQLKRMPHLVGDCTDDDFLKQLGIEHARGIFITTGGDNTNLVICLTARQLNPNIRIVVRIKDIRITGKMKRAGADSIISPNHIGGLRMASEMINPSITSFVDDMTRNTEYHMWIEEVTVPKGFDGKRLEDLHLESFQNTLVLAVRYQQHYEYIPKKDFELREGSQIILMTSREDRRKIQAKLLNV